MTLVSALGGYWNEYGTCKEMVFIWSLGIYLALVLHGLLRKYNLRTHYLGGHTHMFKYMGRAKDFAIAYFVAKISFLPFKSSFCIFCQPVNFNGKCSKLLIQWYKSAVKHIFRPTLDKFCKSPSFNMISYGCNIVQTFINFST